MRNDAYFGTRPRLDGIAFVIFAHGAPAAANYRAFQAGELDVSSVPIGLRRAAEAAYSPQGGFLLALPFTVSYVAPNTAKGPLSNPDARRAVALAIDRDAIAMSLGEGVGSSVGAGSTSALVGPPFGSFYQRGVCDACRYDPTAAKALAGRSGLTPGTRLLLLGSGALVSAYKWTADYPTPDTFLGAILGRTSQQNVARYDNAEFELLMGQARAQKDLAERRQLHQAAERVAIGRDLGVIPTFNPPYVFVVDAQRWADVDFEFFGTGFKYERIHLR